MTLIFIVGVGIYFSSMLLVGYVVSKRVKSMEEYLIAGRRLPIYLAIPAIVATWFGAGSSMGVSGSVYSHGFYSVIPDPFGCSLALLIAGLFFAAKFRRSKLFTISDLLKNAYGNHFERASTILMIPFYIGTLASQMLAMGYVFHIVSGISPEVGIIIGSVIVLTYTAAGGMWAVSITDFIQLAMVLAALLIGLVVCWEHVTDHQLVLNTVWKEFGTLIPTNQSETNWLSYSGRILLTGLGAIMGQDLIQRLMACRSESAARISAVGGAFIYFLLGTIPLFIGIAGREIFPVLERPEQLLPLLAKEFLSPVVFMVFACGLFAAIMSTADSYLLAGTSLMTHNILLRIWPLAEEKKKIRLVRFVSVCMALGALALALSGQTIFDMMVHSGATLFVAIFVPATAALFWKGANPVSGWSALVLGLLSWGSYIGFHFQDLSHHHEDVLFSAASFGAACSLVSYVAVSCLVHRKTMTLIEEIS